jgi:hypothetical protein
MAIFGPTVIDSKTMGILILSLYITVYGRYVLEKIFK